MPQPLGSVPTTKMGETPAETPASSEVDLLKQKMSKFGVLVAGVVLDSGAALAAAKVRFFFFNNFLLFNINIKFSFVSQYQIPM